MVLAEIHGWHRCMSTPTQPAMPWLKRMERKKLWSPTPIRNSRRGFAGTRRPATNKGKNYRSKLDGKYRSLLNASLPLLCTTSFSSVYISSEAVAPVMISTNSPVMTACRVLLYRMVNLLIMSPALLEAF